MPIKWSAVKVNTAADMIETYLNQAAEPLEQARLVARQARKIDNLPQYIDQYLQRLLGDIDQAIGSDGEHRTAGRLMADLENIRKAIPKGAIAKEVNRYKHGSQQSLV